MKRFISLILILITLFSYPLSATEGEQETTEYLPPFNDVVSGCWFDESAVYCFYHGYMKGTSKGRFEPGLNITRAMAVTIFCNLATNDPFYEPFDFHDVKKSDWYYSSVQWAYYNSITNGTSKNTFTPSASITRQDFVTMFFNYYLRFAHMPLTPPTEDDLSRFNDVSEISDYALEPMEWAVKYGIISGFTDSTLRPRATISRAEAVKIIRYYDSVFGHRWQEEIISRRSCRNDGVIKYYCTYCTEERIVTTAAYHLWDEGKVKLLALCESAGIKEYSCRCCNEKREEPISPKGHSWSFVKTVAPTYTDRGYSVYSCNNCNKQKYDDYTDPLPPDDGRLTIDEYLGIKDLVPFLEAHVNDYVGTPYKALEHYFDTPWMLLRDKGRYKDKAMMNCTGFVASVVQRSGGDLSKLVNYNRGAYANGYNWERTIERYGIYHYTFSTVRQALNSGKLRKGDIIYFVPPKDSDCHLGIFWGDTPYDNKIIHCTVPTSYNISSGVKISGVQISGISSGTPYSYFYVLPLGSILER